MDIKNQQVIKKYNFFQILNFLIPSLLGILLFMIPINTDDGITIPVAFVSGKVNDLLQGQLPLIITILISITAILSLITKVLKPQFILNNKYLNSLLNVSNLWFAVRLFGALFVILTYFEIGPAFILSENTGGLILTSLLPSLFGVFLFAGLLLPLLLNFGLLEFCGAMLTKIMRPLFGLPGRASVDCITSWIGDGTIGVLLTSRQYEEGFYSEKEACTIGTNFSAVSITFTFIIIAQVGLQHMFIPFYLTVTVASIIAAIILPRVGPLKNKSNKSLKNEKVKNTNEIPEGHNCLSYGVELATERALKNKGIAPLFIEGFKNVLDMWLGVIPVVMAMGTATLILAEYTPLFKILGIPFIPIFALLGIPEATAAAQTILVGFADMFLPSVMISNVANEMTRFVVACVSVTQLIYMSEVGSVLLGSKIPISFKELFIIFIQRTLITLPIIAIIARFLF
ncbi:MAG: YjiH family protein [Sarcina sp.]